MVSSEMKIFYSWQSDLPGSQTRNLIQDSIDAAVKAMRDTIEIVADRDTKGEFGSPDIVQTIFSKIDDCDIFVADVSIINKYHSIDEDGNPKEDIKTTPNPNVLLELGYAAQALGWENVICIIDTDFGSVKELPFDIKNRRLTPYSLMGKSKAEVRTELRDIIAATVMNLLENGKRTKGSFANHIVGGYDLVSQNVIRKLNPIDIRNSQWYKNKRNTDILECRSLFETIDYIKLTPPMENPVAVESEDDEHRSTDTELITLEGAKLLTLSNELFKKFNKSQLVIVSESDVQFMIQQVKELLDLDLSEDFFSMGNLHISFKSSIIAGKSGEYIGTEEEKTKYDKFRELDYNLSRIQMLDLYVKTFASIYLFPMAIYNNSTHADKNISIIVRVDEETADVILPTADLFNKEIEGLEGLVYEDGIVKDLLLMPESSDIQYDSDNSYDINESISQLRKTKLLGIESSSPRFDSEDYERELKKYIASPMDGSRSNFEFYIKDLRPKEKKWLGSAILVRPKKDKIIFSYSIKSQNSDGALTGTLECEL